MNIAVDIKEVSKMYGDRRGLAPVSASVSTGQVLVVTGPNGSGKSTLLKIIAGLIRPTCGEVSIRSREKTLRREQVRRAVGLVSPELTLYDELTAMENLRFFADLAGLADPLDRAMSLLDLLGLSPRAHDLVGSYSSGMKYRLKYCYALLHEPSLLLLDEPTANLDETGKGLVQDIVARCRRKSCLIIATNDRSEVELGDVFARLGP